MKQPLITIATAILTTGLLSACVQESAVNEPAATGRAVTADDLLVVDCLLPGQVRQLGSRLSYVAARRPIQTTVYDCQIRGGEYVAYDRASYSSALKIWMPLAEQGDADAQNKVGEIYERGMGSDPDYVLASAWYRKAANQGHTRAQINLAFLYEKGLGVEKDQKAALSWYRKASAMPDAVMIERAALEQQQAQINSLQQELNRSRGDVERARRELQQTEQRLQKEREKLNRKLSPANSTSLTPAARAELDASKQALERQRVELAKRQEQIRELESRTRRQQENLLLLETEGSSQRAQLDLVRTQLQRTQSDLQQYQDLAAKNEALLQETRAALAAMIEEKDKAAYQRVQTLAGQLTEREQALGRQEGRVAQLEQRIAELNGQLAKSRTGSQTQVASVEGALQQAQRELVAARTDADQRAAALDQARSELEAEKAKAGAAGERLAALELQLKEREDALAAQQEMVLQLRKESDQLRQKITQLESQPTTVREVADAGDGTAPPSIQLIDPPLIGTRSTTSNKIPVKRGIKKRTVVGQVTAAAGLYSVTINGARAATDDKGLFETDIALASDETSVNVVAVDRQGQRSTLVFSLVTQEDKTMVAKVVNPLKDVDIGSFHALVIGNEQYDTLPDLDTAVADAVAMAEVLQNRFGYKVTLLKNANRYEILSALNKLRKELTDKDNLLVYYAGHGELDRVNLRGHWLPVDAEAHNTANWISNVSITDILNAMSVRQVLLIADSCYSGALTRSALAQIESGQSAEARAHWLKTLAKMRSRTALTSGGLAPVLDGGGGGHSVFAKALLSVLRELDDITEGQRIYREVSARVAYEATRFEVEQVPEYAPIKFAGHESGDFLFIPKTYL